MNRRKDLFGKTLFVDLMMSTLVVVTALLIASTAIEKAKEKQEDANMRTEGVYAIVAEWPDASPDDVDLYVLDPSGNVAFFSSRDVGLMHLEHDDQGGVSDRAPTQGGEVRVQKNEERVVLRGTMPGEYVVNVHMYNKRNAESNPVTVRLVRLKGQDAGLVKKERALSRKGEEWTAFRFRLDEDGLVIDISELPRPLVGPINEQQGGQ